MLHLLPGAYDAALRGSVETYSEFFGRAYDTEQKYIALSYVWGSGENSSTIDVNGLALTITHNLDRCLRQLRQRETVVSLWVDSVCINQDDISEKNQQVALMSCIYSNAQRVDVWLGDEHEYSSIGMQILEYFATHAQPTADAPWRTLPPAVSRLGLMNIMSREWFKRIWVVQEVVLAKQTRLICGRFSFSWRARASEGFMRMIKFACILPDWRQRGLNSITMQPLLKLLDLQEEIMMSNNFGTLRSCADVLDIAYELRDKLASDPRDMLFSIAGMVDGQWNCDGFKADYQLSIEQSYDHLLSVVRCCRRCGISNSECH